jgi:hypothetical protein
MPDYARGHHGEDTPARRVPFCPSGFLSQVHVDPDLAVETFILEPSSTDGAAAQTDA